MGPQARYQEEGTEARRRLCLKGPNSNQLVLWALWSLAHTATLVHGVGGAAINNT